MFLVDSFFDVNDLLIQTRNIDVIMDKIDELKTREEEISKNLYEEKSKEIKVDRQTYTSKNNTLTKEIKIAILKKEAIFNL